MQTKRNGCREVGELEGDDPVHFARKQSHSNKNRKGLHMPDISVPLSLLKKPLEAVFALAAGRAKEELAHIKAEARLKTVYQRLNATQKVKTIWDVDRARSLSSFYYPAKIRTKSGRQQLSSLDELPANAVVLSGTVGQGKSILLRYLLGKEMRSGTRMPLFVELRKVPLSGLDSYIRQMFNELLEVEGHPELFELFANSGRISFLLDGFDEVDPDRAPDLMSAIEQLAAKYPSTRIVVTSRPASGIETSPAFDVVHIAQLTEDDFAGFFSKILSRDRALAELITAALRQSKSVRAVASTPLLATLLTIVYRSTQRIPNDFSEFYDQLFQILLVRHDRSKAYSRKRKTKLGDREMQQAFEAFCYKVHASGQGVISRIKALEISRSAIATRELTCREDDFLDDVIRVTCLLQEEGGNLEFLHQSVREFYAAKYVASRPEGVARKFYAQLGEGGNWRKWDQVSAFLTQLDKYRISQFYLIPMTHRFLQSVQSAGTTAAPPRLRSLMSDLGGVSKNKHRKEGDGQAKFVTYRSYPGNSPHWDTFNARIFQLFFGPGGIAGVAWVTAFDDSTPGQAKTFTELAVHCDKLKELDEFLTKFVGEIKGELVALEASTVIVDSSDEFMGI